MANKSSTGSYHASPARFVILAVLLLILAVAAYALVMKRQNALGVREAELSHSSVSLA